MKVLACCAHHTHTHRERQHTHTGEEIPCRAQCKKEAAAAERLSDAGSTTQRASERSFVRVCVCMCDQEPETPELRPVCVCARRERRVALESMRVCVRIV